MAITVTEVFNPAEKKIILMRFSTFYDDEQGLVCKLAIVNSKLEPESKEVVYEIFDSEETFHKTLRVDAAKENKLVTSLSTDPEWNPEGYSKNHNDETKNNQPDKKV